MTTASSARIQAAPAFREVAISLLLGAILLANYYSYASYAQMIHPLERFLRPGQVATIPIVFHFISVVAVLFSGSIIDRFGIRKALICFSAICLFGSLVQMISPGFIIAGRTFLAIGSEPLGAAVLSAASRKLSPAKLAFHLGIIISLGRLGYVLADMSPNFGFGDLRSVESVTACLALCGFLISTTITLRADDSSSPTPIHDSYKLKLQYMVLVLLAGTFFASIMLFRTLGIDYLVHEFVITSQKASSMISISSLIPFAASPLFGKLADRTRAHVVLITAGSFFLLPAWIAIGLNHRLSLLTTLSFVTIGLCYAAVPANMWAFVEQVVPPSKLGFAYAKILAVVNLSLSISFFLEFKARSFMTESLLFIVCVLSIVTFVAAASLIAVSRNLKCRIV
jgi:MFS family permease